MPSSSYWNLSFVVESLLFAKPKTILDLGIGFGKMGFLAREYLEIWENRVYKKEDWKVRIDGVEIFEDYINEGTRYYYDEIYIGDIIEYVKKNDRYYELITFCDVIEHLPKNVGITLLDELLHRCKYLLLTVPIGKAPQGASFGNEHERHVAEYYIEDIRDRYSIVKEGRGSKKIKAYLLKGKVT